MIPTSDEEDIDITVKCLQLYWDPANSHRRPRLLSPSVERLTVKLSSMILSCYLATRKGAAFIPTRKMSRRRAINWRTNLSLTRYELSSWFSDVLAHLNLHRAKGGYGVVFHPRLRPPPYLHKLDTQIRQRPRYVAWLFVLYTPLILFSFPFLNPDIISCPLSGHGCRRTIRIGFP